MFALSTKQKGVFEIALASSDLSIDFPRTWTADRLYRQLLYAGAKVGCLGWERRYKVRLILARFAVSSSCLEIVVEEILVDAAEKVAQMKSCKGK